MGAWLSVGAKVLWASRRTVEKGYYVRPDSHPWWQYLFVECGAVLCTVEHETLLLTEKHAAMIPGNDRHTFRAESDAQIIEVKFTLDDPWFVQRLTAAQPKMGKTLEKIIDALNHLIDEGVEQDKHYAEMATVRLYELLLLHLRQRNSAAIASTNRAPQPRWHPVSSPTGPDKPKVEEAPNVHDRSKVDQIIAYMRDHLHEDITLDALSRRFGYTRTYLCQLFSTVVDVPPIRYLTLLRLDRAKSLLTHSSLSIAQVRAHTGFNSVHQMWRVFKSETGLSPTEFRKAHARTKTADIHFTDRRRRTIVGSVPFVW